MVKFLIPAICLLFTVASVNSVSAQTNSLTSATSGNWHDLNWSLGIRPASDQTAMIANSGSKAIGVNTATRDSFPATMTVSNLAITAPTGATNTLSLNNLGGNLPFKVTEKLTIGQNGALVNLSSSFVLGSTNRGTLRLEGGTAKQDGGTNTLNGNTYINNLSTYTLTKGTTKTDYLYVGNFGGGTFNQLGGRHESKSIALGNAMYAGQYELSGGDLVSPIFTINVGFLHQTGGNANLATLNVSSYAGAPNLFLDAGTLTAGSVRVGGGMNGQMRQNGGALKATDLRVTGGGSRTYVSYELNGGTVNATTVERGTGASFVQTSGVMDIKGDMIGGISQSGGLLLCANYLASDSFAPTTFVQSAGTNITFNSFVVGGEQPVTYRLSGGQLSCSNLTITSSGTLEHAGGRLVQTGNLILSGKITGGTEPQQFGPLTVTDTGEIDLPNNNFVQEFEGSADKVWTGDLVIRGWRGAANGRGLHQIYFGTNGAGLNRGQLGQIRFIAPEGFAGGNFFAKILDTGEVVPTLEAPLVFNSNGSDMIISWPAGGYALQTSTNTAGPWADVAAAQSPWTNTFKDANRFFRLRNM